MSVNRSRATIIIIALMSLVAIAFQNCSKQSFEAKPPEDTTQSSKGNPDSITTPNGVPANSTLSVPVAEKRKVDILMVVDNSVSMEEEQFAMASKFSGFISRLSNLDWRLAIITTQNETDTPGVNLANCDWPGRDGCLMPFGPQNPWLDSSMSPSQADSLFRQTVQMEPDATYTDERGIHAAYRFLQRYQANEHSFFRDGSHVNLIIISDEDERSIGYHPENENPIEQTDTPDFLNSVYNQILRPESFITHGIITRPGDAFCWMDPNSNGRWPGDIYEDLINLTGGIVGDVCASDYGSQLEQISNVIQQSVYSMPLECEPTTTPVISMTAGSPTVGGVGDNFIDLNEYAINIEFTVNGSTLLFSTPLMPGDQVRADYECAQ